jgi:hypothetical protein
MFKTWSARNRLKMIYLISRSKQSFHCPAGMGPENIIYLYDKFYFPVEHGKLTLLHRPAAGVPAARYPQGIGTTMVRRRTEGVCFLAIGPS